MAKDYILDENGDYLINDGDFFYDDSEDQEVYQILQTNPGEWRESPMIGAGFINVLKTEKSDEDIKKKIDTALRMDDFKDILIEIKNKIINIIKARR